MTLQDAYQRLRPSTDIDRCQCASVESLLLVDLLTDNPIHCGYCRKEIDPERLQLAAEDAHDIAHWFGAASALYRLWLDSGEYEQYAKERLLDPQGQINVAGREIARKLSEKWPTRFWFFSDTDDGEPTHCPICHNPLDEDVKWGTGCSMKAYIDPVSWNMTACGADGGMRSLDLTIEIASRSEAGRILCSPRRCAEVSYLVSIGELEERPPAGYRNVRRKLRLQFADVEVEESGPTEEDISRIIRLADSLKTIGGKVLIHCGAGISRSAAAALILYACWLGPGREQEAMEKVFTLRPIAKPNRRMVMLADKILGREGRLIDALTWKKADFPEHMR